MRCALFFVAAVTVAWGSFVTIRTGCDALLITSRNIEEEPMSPESNEMYEVHAPGSEVPASEAAAGPSYKVLFLKIDEAGAASLWLKPHVLSAKIYDRRTAFKYAAHEAQKFAESSIELVVAVINPMGRCIAVLGQTGRPVRPGVAMRVRKALATLMPSEIRVRRRTSRPIGRSVAKAAARKRRTSKK
jgi:hypothetical protein